MTARPPVDDFASDFDHLDPRFVADPYAVYRDLQGRCPVAHTDRYRGMWVPTRYADLAAVAHDTDHFSSRNVLVTDSAVSAADRGFSAPPITADPPYHSAIRRLLLPAFSPQRIDAWEPQVRQVASDLLDGFDGRDGCDAARDYAQHLPITVIALMLGVPPHDGGLFTRWIHQLIEVGPGTPEFAEGPIMELVGYLSARIEEHRVERRDDLITYLLESEVDGRSLEPAELLGVCLLLLLAGIDTTWSSISSGLLHLATHDDDRRRLVAEPQLVPLAVEEILRAYSPVTMAREVKDDVVFRGCPMKKGDKVLLPFPAGNRDPEAFEDADRVVIDRKVNRHFAFGAGIHRCLGSNLARLELRVAIEEWLRRIPEFRLADGAEVTWSAGQVRGPRSVPVTFGAPA